MQIQTQEMVGGIGSSWSTFRSQDTGFFKPKNFTVVYHGTDRISEYISVDYLSVGEYVQPLEDKKIKYLKQEQRLKKARKLMNTLKPEKIKLDSGEFKKLDNDLILEKTDEGFIIYQIG